MVAYAAQGDHAEVPISDGWGRGNMAAIARGGNQAAAADTGGGVSLGRDAGNSVRNGKKGERGKPPDLISPICRT